MTNPVQSGDLGSFSQEAKIPTDRPLTPLLADRETELWLQIDLLFQAHGLVHPPYRLRDTLVTHLAWAHYGADLDRKIGANARPVAAAPDLLAALIQAEDMLDDVVGAEEACTDEPLLAAWRACKAAIAKATGETQ